MRPSLLDTFCSLNKASVGPEGIRIPQAVALLPNDQLMVMAMAMFGESATRDTYAHIARILIRERPVELAFGMDRFTRPGQGVSTRDCLSVSYWNGFHWRFGVIAYQHEPEIFEPIDWNNAFWSSSLPDEMTGAWRQISAAPHRQPSPAMTVPLPIAPPLEVMN